MLVVAQLVTKLPVTLIEQEGSLPCSQKPATVLLPSKLSSHKRFLPVRFPDSNFVIISYLTFLGLISRIIFLKATHYTIFPAPCYFLPLRAQTFSSHVLPLGLKSKFLIHTNKRVTNFQNLIFMFLDRRRKDKRFRI
jgi:hypothetical protein